MCSAGRRSWFGATWAALPTPATLRSRSGEDRWKLVDPEQTEQLVHVNRLRFDPGDVPRTKFLVGGRAWQMCRQESTDPETFGAEPHRQPRGLWFVRSRLLLDLAALNRQELLLWDSWRATDSDARLRPAALGELDRMAATLSRASPSAIAARRFFRSRQRRPPRRVLCFSPVTRPYTDVLRR